MAITLGPGDDTAVPAVQRSANIRSLPVRLPEKGHIKIGGLGRTAQSQRGNAFRVPEKYNHFRLTRLERGPDGNFIVDKALHDKLALGDAPTEIPIRLLFDSIDLNLQSRYACYAGKTLWCSGDGETAERLDTSFDKAAESKGDKITVPCPCHRQEPDYNRADRCKMNGRLSTMIDGAGGVGGIWVFRTTSFNSITGIRSSLQLLQTITGGLLANLPLKLTIQPKLATSPVNQKPVTIYIVSIEFNGENIDELQQAAHKIALARATTLVSIENIEEQARRRLSLPPPPNRVFDGEGEDPDDITSEFYTDVDEDTAVVDATDPPPRPTRDRKLAPQAEPNTAREPENEREPSEQREPDPPREYAIIDNDGEVDENVPAGDLVKRLGALFDEAARLGLDQWRGIGDSNADLINALKAGDPSEREMAEALGKAYREVAPEEARQPPEKRKRQPRKAKEPDDKREPSDRREPDDQREPSDPREPSTEREPDAVREPLELREPIPTREPVDQREPNEQREPLGPREPSEQREPSSEREPETAREPDTSREPSETREPALMREPNLPREPSSAREPNAQREPNGVREPIPMRDPLWNADVWEVPVLTKANHMLDFGALQRSLMDTAAQARTPDELRKFVTDNERNLRRLHDYSMGVEMTVQARLAEIAKTLEEQRQRGG